MFRNLITVVSALILSCTLLCANACYGAEAVAVLDGVSAGVVAKSFNFDNIKKDVHQFSAFGSRLVGYPGNVKAAEIIEKRFKDLGYTVEKQEFEVVTPIVGSASLEINRSKIRIYPIWPNIARTNQLPPEGLSGKIVYVGDGTWEEFKGKNLTGAIVLSEFRGYETNWPAFCEFGAKAIIFIEPEKISRNDAESKYLNGPASFPRFWVSKSNAQMLKQADGKNSVATVKCEMKWEKKKTWNIFAWVEGSDRELKNNLLVLESYYDSISVVPELSPGAEQSMGIATLLETARLIAQHKPKNSVCLTATSGHFLGLKGSFRLAALLSEKHRSKYEKLDKEFETLPKFKDFIEFAKPKLVISLDIGSNNPNVAMFACGNYFNDDFVRRFYVPVGDLIAKISNEAVTAGAKQVLIDAINPKKGKRWQDFLSSDSAFTCEIMERQSVPGINLVTANDPRYLCNTPLDLPQSINWENMETQCRLIVPVLVKYADNKDSLGNGKNQALFRLKELSFRFERIRGLALEFVRKESFLPSTIVPGALTYIQLMTRSYSGIYPFAMDITDENGKFIMENTRMLGATIQSFKTDPVTGEITYAPDMGSEGDAKYSRAATGRREKERPIILFPCKTFDLYNITDVRMFNSLTKIYVYDSKTDSAPLSYGNLPFEPCLTVFVEEGIKPKVTMGTGVIGIRKVVLNSNDRYPEGRGFKHEESSTIYNTSLRAAIDMWELDEYRLKKLEKHGISNPELRKMHGKSAELLEQAKKCLEEFDYRGLVKNTNEAVGFELRAYPDIGQTANDVVKGVLFYMALLLPFAYFAERLIFGFPDINRMIAGVFGIFLLFFIILRYVHPAFELTTTPWIILLAFIIVALGVIVISIILGKFNRQMEQMKTEQSGVHEADVGRMSAVGVSFSLGISNMRKRRDRTILTSLTLVILTFTVLSFTSVQTFVQTNKSEVKVPPKYDGILLRDKTWERLNARSGFYLGAEHSDKYPIAARYNYISSDLRWKESIEIKYNDKSFVVNGISGFDAEEKDVSGIDRTLFQGSRWFLKHEERVCMLPITAAKALGIEPGNLSDVYVSLASIKLKVIGVYDDKKVDSFTDLDGESMMPVDYTNLPPDVYELVVRTRAKRSAGDYSDEEVPINEYSHMLGSQVIWTDNATCAFLRGGMSSIAVGIKNAEERDKLLDSLVLRYAFNVYSGNTQENTTKMFTALGLTSFSGLGNLFVPILIAALIVLNTMLGSVYERIREISTFSAVGLAPVHISMLFIAEACVYATIGAIAGYLLGQSVSKLLLDLNMLGAMTLNYSSTSTVSTTIIIMLVVLLSTLYPAKQAAEIAVPAMDKKWKLPESDTGEIKVELPFTVSGVDAMGCIGFLKEYFDSHVDYADSNFYNNEVKFWKTPTKYGEGYSIGMDVWLPPYDLGTSQSIELRAIPADSHNIYEIDIILKHRSGDLSSWRRANRAFLSFLRKQFLIWRTVPQYKKEEYKKRICELMEKEGVVS
ncbi:MAG: FtsX-like permease family protein [Elusimicrobiota bacterium]